MELSGLDYAKIKILPKIATSKFALFHATDKRQSPLPFTFCIHNHLPEYVSPNFFCYRILIIQLRLE